MYRIEIYARHNGEVVETMTARTRREAERVEDGALINMNLADYGTRIVAVGQEDS